MLLQFGEAFHVALKTKSSGNREEVFVFLDWKPIVYQPLVTEEWLLQNAKLKRFRMIQAIPVAVYYLSSECSKTRAGKRTMRALNHV